MRKPAPLKREAGQEETNALVVRKAPVTYFSRTSQPYHFRFGIRGRLAQLTARTHKGSITLPLLRFLGGANE